MIKLVLVLDPDDHITSFILVIATIFSSYFMRSLLIVFLECFFFFPNHLNKVLYLNSEWDWKAILSWWVSQLLLPILYIDYQSSLLNSNITKIEVWVFLGGVFTLLIFRSFLSRMSVVFDFFLLLKTRCYIIRMINRCCQIGSRNNWCHPYALPPKNGVFFA